MYPKYIAGDFHNTKVVKIQAANLPAENPAENWDSQFKEWVKSWPLEFHQIYAIVSLWHRNMEGGINSTLDYLDADNFGNQENVDNFVFEMYDMYVNLPE